jgi:hypothetical protein
MTLITHFKITFFTNLPENAPVRIQRTVKNISIPVRIKYRPGSIILKNNGTFH